MEREKLIEEIGVHFESVYNLPPLAARIYAILIMGNEEGYSFEALVEEVAASKSTVSTSLNLLLQLQKIEYFTKTGDRKRYFRKKINYLKTRLVNYITILEDEIAIFHKTSEYMKSSRPVDHEKNKSIVDIYHCYLHRTKELMQETVAKLEEACANRDK
ncbi:GbsR/MarR family transcriptional regulator [Imtechella halotolerans]|uniref:Transcriptional regulator n=1 Tax=Imtechella halotolerans K1 TaxID=946077 RepID=I0WEC3_9FLAO|nr:transcriptional regulator [Imtechella halotolerans]EID74739.1 transcriptional regulator [Imtechella halotolerans K1]WMQ64140.1 transcriptional regulator [Imtechella halotolerans]